MLRPGDMKLSKISKKLTVSRNGGNTFIFEIEKVLKSAKFPGVKEKWDFRPGSQFKNVFDNLNF